MKIVFKDPLVVRNNIQKMDIAKLRNEIKNIITPNRNDEWLDESKHYKEAAAEVLELLFKTV